MKATEAFALGVTLGVTIGSGIVLCAVIWRKTLEPLPTPPAGATPAPSGLATEDAPVPVTDRRIYTVCLTGGPCSGKSTSLALFVRELTARGFDVYCAPEVPTMVVGAGFPYPGMDSGPLLYDFELGLFRTQLAFEDTVLHMAAQRDALLRKRPAVVIFDRGLLDMKGAGPLGHPPAPV